MNLLNLFSNETELLEFTDGEVVFREGSPGDCLYVVIEGGITITSRGRILNVVGPGDLFGEMALIDDEPRSATATASGRVRLAVISEQRFTFLVQQTPYFALHVMRVLVGRLRSMDRTLS